MNAKQLIRDFGIGLSGGVATGKSLVSGLLRDMGHKVIDADMLARQAVAPHSPALADIATQFGRSVFNPDGTLHRLRLRELIFNDTSKRKALEDIVHPRIRQLLAAELQQAGFFTQPRLWFYEAALLVETGTYRQFKQLWVTYCSPATQIARLCQRDGISSSQAQAIIAAQLPTAAKLTHAHLCIDTEQDSTAIKTLLTQHLDTL